MDRVQQILMNFGEIYIIMNQLVLIIYKGAERSFVQQPVILFILFSAVMGKQFYKNPSKKEIEEAFRYFDTDNSGKFLMNCDSCSNRIN